MSTPVVVKKRQRSLSDNKVFVGRHEALYEYCREIGLIGHNTPAIFNRCNISHIKDKDVVGILPLEMAAFTRTYTEIRLTCHVEPGIELTLEDIRLGAKPARKYKIEMMEN